jgi:hypothetical protein
VGFESVIQRSCNNIESGAGTRSTCKAVYDSVNGSQTDHGNSFAKPGARCQMAVRQLCT